MRKIIFTLAACALGQQASATVIYSQNFDAAGIGTTIAGWTHETGNPWTVQTDATLDPTGNVYRNSGGSLSDDQKNVGLNHTPVTLGGVGDFIQASFDYRYLAAPTSAGNQPFNFFRFGLYTNNGTGSTYYDDVGYLADVTYWDNTTPGPPTKYGEFALREEANWYSGVTPPEHFSAVLLDNESAANYTPPPFPTVGDIVTLANVAKTVADGTSVHTATLRLTRTSTGIETRLNYDGSDQVFVVDTTSPNYVFDTLYFEGPSDSNGFAVDNILIETGSVPEPSRAALVLCGMCGMIFRRRR